MSRRKAKEFSIVCFASFAIITGCFIFCRGFLLNRQVFTEKATPCLAKTDSKNKDDFTSCIPLTPAFSKTIFLLLDAFRYDFIFRMPFLSSVVEQGENASEVDAGHRRVPQHSSRPLTCAFKFIADPPTTTMQRLKALMTGTMPTFIDASANFNSYEVQEDNLIYQLNAAGKRIAFLGDDTWLSLFPRSLFTAPYVEAHPSFDAWDLDTVDRAVNTSLARLMEAQHAPNWDILIAHLLGVDHCGHRYGPAHPEMNRKLSESDKTIEHLYRSMSDDTLLIVFGDHGMTKSGDHGGDSENEVEAGIVFITKQSTPQNLPFQCHSKMKHPVSVSQVDLVPTMSMLLGIPIPFSSIGQIFPKFLTSTHGSQALMQNVFQVFRFVTDYAQLSSPELLETYEKVKNTFQEFVQDRNSSTESKFQLQAANYLSSVKRLALSTWTEFDMISISWGTGITCLAILSFVYTIHCHFGKGFHWILVLLPSGVVLSVLFNYIFESAFGLNGIIACTSVSFLLFLFVTTSITSKSPVSNSTTGPSDTILLCLYFATCVGVFSNSFVINEGSILGSALMVSAIFHVVLQSFEWKDLQFNSFTKKSRGFLLNKKFLIWKSGVRCSWISLACLAVMLRIAGLFFRCREELTNCQEEFMLHKNLASLPETWIAYKCVRFGVALLSVAIFVVTFREWMMLRECISSSKRPTALIGKYIPTILIVLTGAHWALEGLPFSLPHMIVIRPALSYFPIVYQTMTILSLLIVWIQPLCSSGCSSIHRETSKRHGHDKTLAKGVKTASGTARKLIVRNGLSSDQNDIGDNDGTSKASHNADSSEKESVFYLLANGCHQDVFTCSLLVNCVLVTLLLVQVTATGITPAVMMIPYVIIAGLSLNVDSAVGQGSWSIAILWTLASQYFFYCSGHQPVFSAIPWDSAFMGSSEGLGSDGSSSWIVWIRPGMAVLGNLHVSQIIFSTALPLLVYGKGPTVPGTLLGRRERSTVYVIGGKFIILHSLKLLACMLCAAFLRRHLMVWKIFAPKLIFEIISFLVTSISTILSLLFVTRIDHHYQQMLAKEVNQLKQLLKSSP